MHNYFMKRNSTKPIQFSKGKFTGKIKAIAGTIALSLPLFIAIISTFQACNSTEPDTSAPTLTIQIAGSNLGEIDPQKTTDKIRFGITDTIIMTFSEKIDTASLRLSFDPPQNIGYHFDGETKVLIFGKNKNLGSSYFNLKSPFTATLSGLQDQHSNGQVQIQSSFEPYTWGDLDFIDSNFRGYDSLFRNDSVWVDGKSIHDSLIVEGALDDQKLLKTQDVNDIQVVSIAVGDTLFASLKTQPNLNLSFKVAGPFLQKDIDSILAKDKLDTFLADLQTNNSGKASVKIIAEYDTYRRKLGDGIKHGLYLFVIRVPQQNAGFYRLGARIHAFK